VLYTDNGSDFTSNHIEQVGADLKIGNFRLLNRLLTQVERILEINALPLVTKEVAEAARENLVIGQAWKLSATPTVRASKPPPRTCLT
jgi:hypothetical protein